MLSLPQSLPTEFLASYGVLLLAVAFAWAMMLVFFLAENWRKRQGLILKAIDISITAAAMALMMYLPFLALALSVDWWWF